MLYFKKADLAKAYHVSEKTVTNWMKEARSGKLDLELHEVQGRTWIANTTRNITIIDQLVENRKKFRNSRGVKIVAPKPEFYKLYSPEQVFDIASNIDIHREIPFQYGYFDGGADYWDQYAQRLATEEVPNFLNNTVKQLQTSEAYIDDLLRNYSHVNVIDIGPGNGLPVRNFLRHLLEQDKLRRYVAVDISASMLRIAERNIRDWFGSQVVFEGNEADINYDRFIRLLTDDAIGEEAGKTINLVLALGGTFANLRLPDGAFRAIHDSMNRCDLFIYNLKLDTEVARQYFDFGINQKAPPLDAKAKMVLDLLNIDESFYEPEMGFDSKRMQRYIRIRLKVALTIKFGFEKGECIVRLNKGDAILLWRYRHQNVQDVTEQLNRTDFDALQTSLTEDREYLLTISRVKSER